MKKIIEVLPFLVFSLLKLNSQCATPNDDFTTYGAGGLPIAAAITGNEVNINTTVWGGSYTTIGKIVAGTSYTVSVNQTSSGGLQVYQNGSSLGTGSSSVTFTAATNQNINVYVCGTDMNGARILSMTGSGSLGTVYNDFNSPGNSIVYPLSSYMTTNPSAPSFVANTTGATNETALTNLCGSGSPFNSRRDVWFNFTLAAGPSRPITIRHDNIIPTERSNVSISPTSLVGIAVYSGNSSSTTFSCVLTTLGSSQVTTGNLSAGTYKIRVFSNLGDFSALELNSFQTNFFVFDPNLTLPVELISFKTQQKNNTNHLAWQTASEKNNSHFEIERSTTGQEDWVKLGTVKGNGNSQIMRDYSFTDNNPLSITTYYRLKQVDNEGSFEYSNVVSVTTKGGKFKVNALTPNPTKDNLAIQFESNKNEVVNVSVMDMTGRVVLTQNASATEGANFLNVNTAILSNGLYMVSLKNSESVILNKIVKN